MDEDTKRALAQILTEIQALKIVVNEAFAIVLSQTQNPDVSASLVRQDIENVISKTEKKAIASLGDSEYRRQQFAQIRDATKIQLDAIEKRVSRLKIGRTSH